MIYTYKYKSPLGHILLAADEVGITGLWFEGQKYFGNTLPDKHIPQETEILTEAKKWLDERKISYEDRHIAQNNPTEEELKEWYKRSGLPLKRFFNTSGLKYKELGLKDKLPEMSEEDQLKLLATDGMLVKRPLIVAEDFILTGFKEKEWEEKMGDNLERK